MFMKAPETEIARRETVSRSWLRAENTWEGIPADCESLFLNAQKLKSLQPLLGFARLKELRIVPVRPRELDVLAQLTKLKELHLFDVRVEGLQALGELRNLDYLEIMHGGKLRSLSGLEHFTKLQFIRIYHLPNVSNLEPLSALTRLRELSIQMSFGTNKLLKFDSLSPIGGLSKLEVLELRGVQPRDLSLRPLARLKNLKYLALGFFLPIEEYAYLAAHLPAHVSDCLRPYIPNDADESTLVCKKCKRPLVMLVGRSSGRSRGFLCAECNKAALDEHVRVFNDFVRINRKSR